MSLQLSQTLFPWWIAGLPHTLVLGCQVWWYCHFLDVTLLWSAHPMCVCVISCVCVHPLCVCSSPLCVFIPFVCPCPVCPFPVCVCVHPLCVFISCVGIYLLCVHLLCVYSFLVCSSLVCVFIFCVCVHPLYVCSSPMFVLSPLCIHLLCVFTHTSGLCLRSKQNFSLSTWYLPIFS